MREFELRFLRRAVRLFLRIAFDLLCAVELPLGFSVSFYLVHANVSDLPAVVSDVSADLILELRNTRVIFVLSVHDR